MEQRTRPAANVRTAVVWELLSAVLAERGRRRTLIWVTVGIGAFGLVLAPMLSAGP